MKLEKDQLLKQIKDLSIILNNKDQLLFLDKKIISKNNNMQLFYNTKIDFNFSTNPEKIIKYLEKVKTKDIEIELEKDNLILKNEKTELVLKVNIDIKDKILECKDKWDPVPDNFYEGLHYSLFSSTDLFISNHSYIGFVCFINDRIFSTDNKKLSEYKLNSEMSIFAINYTIAQKLLNINNITHFNLLEDKILFKNKDELNIMCLTQDVKPPEYSKILKLEKNVIKIDFLNCIIEGLDFCEILNQDLHILDKKIYFEIKDDNLSIYTDSVSGKIKYKYKLDKKYDTNMFFILNPDLIKEIIKQKNFECYYNFGDKLYFINDKYTFVVQVKIKITEENK